MSRRLSAMKQGSWAGTGERVGRCFMWVIVHKPPAAVVGKTFAIRTFSFASRTFGHFPPDA
ncbi:MAG: hypothetical protein ACKN9W_01690 [Methylococcus sp.]